MLEKELEAKIVKYCRERDVLCYKFSSPAHSGVPDRMLVGPSGRIIFLEIKAPGKQPTALQLHELSKLIVRGVKAVWTDNIHEARRTVDEVCR